MIDRKEQLRKLVFKGLSFSRLPDMLRPVLGGQGAILMLHRVTGDRGTKFGFNQNLVVRPEFLDRLIVDMKGQGFDFVSLDEAIRRIGLEDPQRRFAVITLDDGFLDNLTEALPVFDRHATPFTVFIAPGLTDGSVDAWWDLVEATVEAYHGSLSLAAPDHEILFDCSTAAAKTAAFEGICRVLSEDVDEEDQVAVVRSLAAQAGIDTNIFRQQRLMTWDDIRKIAAHPLCTVGAHTVHHHNLKRLTADNALREMVESADILENRLGTRPRHFAYPYGFKQAVGEREARLARQAGFDSALTTRHGMIQKQHAHHLHCLPRISVNGRYQSIDFLKTMLSGVTTPIVNRGQTVVTV